MLNNARHILSHYTREYTWKQALQQYRVLEERLRGYEVCEGLEQFAARQVTVCSDRFETYGKTLTRALPFRKVPFRWAAEGTYLCKTRKHWVSVNIPADFILPPPAAAHDLKGQTTRPALEITWADLLETARWMDEEARLRGLKDVHWNRRLRRVHLELLDSATGTFTPADRFTLNRMMHLIGMVSSGKSTLMDILAVWAARKGLRITLVVGDVISALNRARQFVQLGLDAAPILGASNRERHINRLHRVRFAEEPYASLLDNDPSYQWLSTACPLDELRERMANGNRPFALDEQPCFDLYAPKGTGEDDKKEKTGAPYACPLYSGCPSHRAQRDLVTARIWIATPASLVYTRVAPQLNREKPRFAELVYRSSDLVIIDEADQVQVQLDTIFSPSQALVGGGDDAWLDRLGQHVDTRLRSDGRRQLSEEPVRRWSQAHGVAQQATNRVYSLLLTEHHLRKEIERDYFAPWLLFDSILDKLTGVPRGAYRTHPDSAGLKTHFDGFLNDPLGENNQTELTNLASQVVLVGNEAQIKQRLVAWVKAQVPTLVLSKEKLDDVAVRLEFALLVAVLADRLNLLLGEWRNVEDPFQLEGGPSFLFHNAPADFMPVIPTAPMGNVLGFQYFHSSGDSPEGGTLRFLRCDGVGRWLLLHLHELFAGDGIAGPHVLLLSGTSWAAASPSYHVQVPVAGLLRAPQEEVNAIADSVFQFEPFHNSNGEPIRVSGQRGHAREEALRALLHGLAHSPDLGGLSRLERERDELPSERQRILLLVGSYVEAKLAADYLEQLRPDWRGKVRNLVPDDDEYESHLQEGSRGLRRGLVHHFPGTGAWLLVAPLLAVERGHNILNEQGQAAIAAAYFLVRPHPRPDDPSFAIHSINRFAIERYTNAARLRSLSADGPVTFQEAGIAFRAQAFGQWRRLLKLPMIHSTLPKEERQAVTWNQLVTIWQVIGRLVRGGTPARVYFCDAAFGPRSAAYDEDSDTAATSLLVSIKEVLQPYFDPVSSKEPADRALAEALYGPFYQGIQSMGGIADVQLTENALF